MSEYTLKGFAAYSPRLYTEPSVSYFDSILTAGEKTVSALALTAGAVATALLSCLCTSMRGHANCLEE